MSDQPENTPENTATPEGAIGEITHGPSALEQFLDQNQSKLIIAGLALIIGLIGYVVWGGLKKVSEQEASAAVSSAKDISELRAAADEHRGTNAAGAALVKIAQQQWDDQQKDEAVATLEKFIADHPSHRLFYNAKAALGSYYLQLGKVSDAKAVYQEVVEKASLAHELYGVALLNLGDIALRENDPEAAKGFYEKIGVDLANRPVPGIKKMATDRLEIVGVSAPTPKVEVPEPAKPATPDTPGAAGGVITPTIPADPAPGAPITVPPAK